MLSASERVKALGLVFPLTIVPPSCGINVTDWGNACFHVLSISRNIFLGLSSFKMALEPVNLACQASDRYKLADMAKLQNADFPSESKRQRRAFC